jgi:hypothetical protein
MNSDSNLRSLGRLHFIQEENEVRLLIKDMPFPSFQFFSRVCLGDIDDGIVLTLVWKWVTLAKYSLPYSCRSPLTNTTLCPRELA